MLKWSLVLCSVVAASLAARSVVLPLAEKPDKFKDVEGCYVERLGLVVPYGQRAPTFCLEYSCTRDNLIENSCDAVPAPIPPLTVDIDSTKVYPECCPKIRDTRWLK